MRVLKPLIVLALFLFFCIFFSNIAFNYYVPEELCVEDNLLTIIGLYISFFTLLVTIGMALFIYWLQSQNVKREAQRRIEQAKASMLLAVEKAFKCYFFVSDEDRDEYYCEGVKDVFNANIIELRGYLSPKEFDQLVEVVNTIDKKDSREAYRYVRDWLQPLYLSSYQEFMACALEYEDILDKRTFELIDALNGRKKKYKDLHKINGNEDYILFEKKDKETIVICDDKLWLQGILGYAKGMDEIGVLSGYGVSEQYEGFYKDGVFEGKGVQFYEGHHKLKEGIWEKGKLVNGIEYEYIIKVTGGMLTYNSKNAAYEYSLGFEYEKYCQYGIEETKPFRWIGIPKVGEKIGSFYVADIEIDGDKEKVTNIRPFREFLEERNPKLLNVLGVV